jgi:hypothetical protein
LYSALAWATGLAILFIGGKLLSAATLWSAQADDPNATITPIQRGLRRAYRTVINVAALYYYISLPFVALLAIGVATSLIYGVLMLPKIPVKLLCVVFLFGLAMLSTIWSSIRSLFVRVRDDDPGPELTVEEAPWL